MKKLLVVLSAFLFILGAAVSASAVPFVIEDSALSINWNSGTYAYTYTPNAVAPFELAEGESQTVTFGTLTFASSFWKYATGTGTFEIFFSTPDMVNPVQNPADITAWSLLWSISQMSIAYDDTNQDHAYTYLGSEGIMHLAMVDVDTRRLSFQIQGTITNAQAPVGNGGGSASVPEPGTVLLLGAGLMGLAGYTRFRKKS